MEKNRKKFRRGFTLVEIVAVLIIIGLLAMVGAINYLGKTDKARVITTKANLKMLHSAVATFKMDTGRFPSEDEGLEVLIEAPADIRNYEPGGYLETTDVPPDAWGNEFIYQRYPESGKAFVIKSLGADNEEGGEDYDADLLSTDAD